MARGLFLGLYTLPETFLKKVRFRFFYVKYFSYISSVIIETTTTMKEIINLTGIPTGNTINNVTMGKIKNVRFISKTRAGYMTVTDARNFEIESCNANKENLINGFLKGALQTVQVQFENSDYFFTVFARVGKKVHLIDEAILADLTEGTINQLFYNTSLYSQLQYQAVGSKTWASKAFVQNEVEVAT